MTADLFASALARCFLSGEPTLSGIVERSAKMLGGKPFWIARTAGRYLEARTGKIRPVHEDVVDYLLRDPDFLDAWEKSCRRLRPLHYLVESQQMQPVAEALDWRLPPIETARDLADWFWLEDSDLQWFADLSLFAAKSKNQKLCHYHYRVLAKATGGYRLLEAPKRRLKSLQRQILEDILDKVAPHPAVHGFVKDRSVLTFAAPHAQKAVVLRIDLKDFFPSFSAARIRALFRTFGYPEAVSDLLGGICTNLVPPEIWKQTGEELYSVRHLPQGAPTSPALANLCSYRMDCRLHGLATASGATYTRYADDLAFSGPEAFARTADRFASHAAAILLEEGFSVQHRKTRTMRRGVRQHLTGLVVNQHPNVKRDDFDTLKAILTNCARHGPQTQNRSGHPSWREHLNGKVAFVEMVNAEKGKRLREIFTRISWLP